MTTITVWVLFLYFSNNGYREAPTISVAVIDNIVSQEECELKLKESVNRWKAIKNGMCMSVQKIK